MSLYIFDKDLTLVEGLKGHAASSLDEQPLLPNVSETCAELRSQGHKLAVASNQGGVAFGVISEETARLLVSDAAEKIGAIDFEFCCHHPKGKVAPYNHECPDRKPGPGMLITLMNRLGFTPEDTIFIGDSEADCQAAEAAGVKFIHADTFFRRTAH